LLHITYVASDRRDGIEGGEYYGSQEKSSEEDNQAEGRKEGNQEESYKEER